MSQTHLANLWVRQMGTWRERRTEVGMADEAGISFAQRLKQLRDSAGKKQEGLAESAGLSTREVSDLERGITKRPRKETVRALADALHLEGQERDEFMALAEGRDPAGAAVADAGKSTSFSGTPQAWMQRVITSLDVLGVVAARSVMAEWQRQAPVDPAWLEWLERDIQLTAQGNLHPAAQRPSPTADHGESIGRDRQAAELNGFVDRIQRGRCGLALVHGPAGIGKSRLVIDVITRRLGDVKLEWITFDREEAGYRGWRRLLEPLWSTIRRAELAPADLQAHATTLDDLLLTGAAGGPFPGEAADAVAALLEHVAARQPLLLFIDDAHRGGTSSDQLLVHVAQRMNACSAGIIAALRQDELEENSPFRHYTAQAAGRAALDVVVPISVPPFDHVTTAILLRKQTGFDPPPRVVDQVRRQTGGCPQLIENTDIKFPVQGVPASAWTVGGLNAEGLRVLEPTIQNCSEQVREVLLAAALCAVGGEIEPALIARVIDLPTDRVEELLDAERQRGPILAQQAPGYSFAHDNWIDALVIYCPAPKRRALHARCLALLQADRTADPQRLARHAIGAGADLVGSETLASLAREAGDQALADCAFGTAAELYAAAAQHSTGTERVILLVGRSDALRFGGAWDEARGELKSAAAIARGLGAPGVEAVALIHLDRLTWSYGLDETEMLQQLRDMISRLPAEERVLRAQVQAALAQRLSVAERLYEDEQITLAQAALEDLPLVPADSLPRADTMLGIRSGLQDFLPPEELLEYAQKTLDLAIRLRSAYHIGEALVARIIDLIRCGRLLELQSAVRKHRDFAERSGAEVNIYGQGLIDAMLALARGEFADADNYTDEARRHCSSWGESMAQEALMAQGGWRLYESGMVDGLTDILALLREQEVSTLNEPVWLLGAGLIHAEQGHFDAASHALREVCVAYDDLRGLPRGPSRIGILATAAMLIGHPLLCDSLPSDEAVRWGSRIAELLTLHQDVLVLAGWPAVLLGSKHRFIGLALLAAQQPAEATRHLDRATDQNAEFAVLSVRTRFDRARTLIRQPASHAEGIAELERVALEAARLKMASLVTQAAAEPDRWPRPGH
jgi:hypothetical protein